MSVAPEHVKTALILIGGGSIALMFVIESGAWFFRAQASREELGQMLARANQLLYSSRLFAFGFQLIISLMVDKGMGVSVLATTFLLGFGLSAFIHLFAYHHPSVTQLTLKGFKFVAPGVMSERRALKVPPRMRIDDFALFRRTIAATLLFAAAATIPYLLAHRFNGVRMTMGSIAQMMNFLGSITLISLVEPLLYRAIDASTLETLVFDYLLGRFWGFIVCFLVTGGLILLT